MKKEFFLTILLIGVWWGFPEYRTLTGVMVLLGLAVYALRRPEYRNPLLGAGVVILWLLGGGLFTILTLAAAGLVGLVVAVWRLPIQAAGWVSFFGTLLMLLAVFGAETRPLGGWELLILPLCMVVAGWIVLSPRK